MPNHDNVISDGIFDKNLDCMEKLNPNYYFDVRAVIWYRYWPYSSVPLVKKMYRNWRL